MKRTIKKQIDEIQELIMQEKVVLKEFILINKILQTKELKKS